MTTLSERPWAREIRWAVESEAPLFLFEPVLCECYPLFLTTLELKVQTSSKRLNNEEAKKTKFSVGFESPLFVRARALRIPRVESMHFPPPTELPMRRMIYCQCF